MKDNFFSFVPGTKRGKERSILDKIFSSKDTILPEPMWQRGNTLFELLLPLHMEAGDLLFPHCTSTSVRQKEDQQGLSSIKKESPGKSISTLETTKTLKKILTFVTKQH
jgi:hypothetical protein